jgi:hypothetical protein
LVDVAVSSVWEAFFAGIVTGVAVILVFALVASEKNP